MLHGNASYFRLQLRRAQWYGCALTMGQRCLVQYRAVLWPVQLLGSPVSCTLNAIKLALYRFELRTIFLYNLGRDRARPTLLPRFNNPSQARITTKPHGLSKCTIIRRPFIFLSQIVTSGLKLIINRITAFENNLRGRLRYDLVLNCL
jgi:hypothetical protein